MPDPILTFGIPVRPNRNPERWPAISANIREAVQSCLSQTDPNVRVVLACNVLPEGIPRDSRIEVLEITTPRENPRLDKGGKKHAIARRIREDGGGFLMIVDDDDIVSRRVAAYVASRPDVDAFFAWHGYELDADTLRVRYAPQFHHLCGTSAAIRYRVSELPDSDDETDAKRRWIVRAGHQQWRQLCIEAGKRVAWFPFPAALYRVNTGYNINKRAPRGRRMFRAITPLLAMGPRTRRDFGFA